MQGLGDDRISTLIQHYAHMVLRVLLRKPVLLNPEDPSLQSDRLSVRSAQSNLLASLVTSQFVPADLDNSGSFVNGTMYLVQLFVDRIDSVFVQILRAWYVNFYALRHSINWSRFYETGDLKLTGYAAATAATVVSTNTIGDEGRSPPDQSPSDRPTGQHQQPQQQGLGSGVGGGGVAGTGTVVPEEDYDKFNNDKLFRHYERFVLECRNILARFANRLFVRTDRLCVSNLLKSDFSVDDTRLIHLLIHDLVDLLDRYFVPVPIYHVDGGYFRDQYMQARRAIVLERADLIAKLFTTHRGFAMMKDWLFVRETLLRPLQVRFNLLDEMSTKIDAAPSSSASVLSTASSISSRDTRDLLNELTIYTVHEFHTNSIVLSLHDLVVRYMLRKYFRRNAKFGDSVDPYSRGEVREDQDLAHFFVFLVNRCLGREVLFDYTVDTTIFHEFDFWRRTLAHIASIAPHTFVAQVHTFIAPLYRGSREIRVHDILDYVTWLCSDDPWYVLSASVAIERMRCIDERKLRQHFVSLYDCESLLFYVLIENNFATREERVRRIAESTSVLGFVDKYDDRRGAAVCSTAGTAKAALPNFNWKIMFETFFDTSIYEGTVSQVFAIVRSFFRYIITKSPFDCPNDKVSSDIINRINELVASRLDRKSRVFGAQTAAATSGGRRSSRKSTNNGHSQQSVDSDNLPSTDAIETETTVDTAVATATTAAADDRRDGSSSGVSQQQRHTFEIVWAEADATMHPAYVEILQKILNFLNTICIMFNGVLANTGSADYMRQMGLRNMQLLLKKEQGFWTKDKLLRVYSEIFKDFDMDGFENACRRMRMTSLPNTVIGNCFASVTGVNLNFLRVASSGRGQQVIWNLTTRCYEPAAPSLLYLLVLDTNNWFVTDDESFPSVPDPLVTEFASRVISQMDQFVADAQRLDALSMMLYTRLILKKRIGDSCGNGSGHGGGGGGGGLSGVLGGMPDDDVDRAEFVDRLIRSMMSAVDVSMSPDDDGDGDQSSSNGVGGGRCSSSEPSLSDDRSNEQSSSGGPTATGPQRPIKYVDFIIDRDEFFRLARHVPVNWVYEFVEHMVGQVKQNHSSNCRIFVQILLMLVQLIRDARFTAFVLREGFSQNLADELLESSISMTWLRKRKHGQWLVQDQPSILSKRMRLNDHGTTAAAWSGVISTDHDADEIPPFSRLVDRQLMSVDLSGFVDDYESMSAFQETRRKFCRDAVVPTFGTVARRTVSSSSSTVGPPESDTADDDTDDAMGLWDLTVSTAERQNEMTTQPGSESAAYVNGMLSEREFRLRTKRMLRDPVFYRWSIESLSMVTLDHLHQLDDRTLHSAVCAYIYVVRVTADLSLLDDDSDGAAPRQPCLGEQLRDLSPLLLNQLYRFFPCRFTVSTKTLDMSNAMTTWLENRVSSFRKRSSKARATTSKVDRRRVASDGQGAVGVGPETVVGCGPAANGTEDNNQDTDFDYDDLLNDIASSFTFEPDTSNSPTAADPANSVAAHVTPSSSDFVVSSSLVLPYGQTRQSHGGDRYMDQMEELVTLYDSNVLSRAIRESIVYFCMVVYVFCDLDTAVSLYMLRLIASFMYPGVESRYCTIVRGSSGSGKSQFFELVRDYFNSSSGVLTTQAISTGCNLINTQLMPVGKNFLCQCDEPKRVDNETFKLLISVVPIAARSFQNQMAQTIPILSKLVITVNNMFQIESDDGILERLHSVFRLSHKHYNLVNEQTDMVRYNSGSSWNVSHQFTDRVFPRDIDKTAFLRGMFHVIHHWSSEQTVRPNASYALADQLSAMSLRTMLTTLLRQQRGLTSSVTAVESSRSTVDGGPSVWSRLETWNDYELSRSLDPRYDGGSFGQVCNHVAVLSNVRDKLGRVFCSHDSAQSAAVIANLLASSNSHSSRDIARNTVLAAGTLDELFGQNVARSVLRWQRARINTDLRAVVGDSLRNAVFKRQLGFYKSREHLLCLFMHDECVSRFSSRFPALADVYRNRRNGGHANADKLYFTLTSGFDSDRNIDVSVLPCTLDLNLMDVQVSLDPFVRFKRTFVVEYSDVPMTRELLRKQLNAYVDELNMIVEDPRYRIKYKDFHDRFEIEYGKFRYKRPDNNEIVSNLWCVRLRRAN